MKNKRVAVFVDDGFEDLEFYCPVFRLREEGIGVVIVGQRKEPVRGKHEYVVTPQVTIDEVRAEDFDGLVIPGGKAPENLRINEMIVEFTKKIYEQGKVIAAICHGQQILISAGILKGKKVTCVKKIRDDVINAGAEYVDEPVVVDGKLITSRIPMDLPYFCSELVKSLRG